MAMYDDVCFLHCEICNKSITAPLKFLDSTYTCKKCEDKISEPDGPRCYSCNEHLNE